MSTTIAAFQGSNSLVSRRARVVVPNIADGTYHVEVSWGSRTRWERLGRYEAKERAMQVAQHYTQQP